MVLRRKSVIFFTFLFFVGFSACVSKKKKNKPLSFTERAYQNMTAHYNGYFNANEIYKESYHSLYNTYQDNYNQILPLYPTVATDQHKTVEGDMKTATDKLAHVVKRKRRSDWTDDAYLLFGKCKFLEKDYETAEEAFEYLYAEYNLKALEIKKKGKKRKKKRNKKRSAKDKKEEKPEKYVFSKRPAFEEGRIWLAKTYIERERYDDAEILLISMKNDPKTHKDNFDNIEEVLAYNQLKQKNYDAAIPLLKNTYELSKRRKNKVRYAYIIAQLLQQSGQNEEAMAYFKKALKHSPKYDMEFNARLSMITNAWVSGKESGQNTIKSLNKMLKDSKNKEYKDRIYYTLAQVQLKNKNKKEAIASLQKSLEFNTNNPAQKAESYLLLADLHYDAEDYVEAKSNYDQALLSLSKTDDRLERVKKLSENLEDIAKNIQIITLQDSLLAIHDMSPSEKRMLAAQLIQKQKEEEAAKATAKAETQGATSSTNALGAAKSRFFAYNDRALKRGKKSFEKRWGTRTLTDNWRRSARKDADNITEESTPDEIAENLTEEEVQEVFKDVPSSTAEVLQAKHKVQTALFHLGTAYRDKIANNEKSVSTLEELLKRFPKTENKLETYYNLYLAYTELNNKTKAKYYYNQIVSEFPNTTYARVLNDPNYINELNNKQKEVSNVYHQAYASFKKRDYQTALNILQQADAKFGKLNSMKPKYALLMAMCTGSIGGKEAYKKAIKDVVAKYADSDEGKKAKEILRYLNGETVLPAPTPKEEETAPKKKDKKKDKPNNSKTDFVKEFDKGHYLIAILADGTPLRSTKDAVNKYNRKAFKGKPYRANSIYLKSGNKSPLVIVRRFKNKEEAMVYYHKATSDKFLGKGVEAEVVVISQGNYRKMLRAKDAESYVPFFKQHYK